jgi:hypothetical protein
LQTTLRRHKDAILVAVVAITESKMACEAFDSETLHILGNATDQAWRRVKFNQLNGSASGARTILASQFSLWPEKASETLSA